MNSVRVRLACGLAAGLSLAFGSAAFGQGMKAERSAAAAVEKAQPVEAAQPVQLSVKRPAKEPKIDRYARVLGLDETQLEVARDLSVAYERSSAEARKAMNAAMKTAQSDLTEGDHRAFQEKMDKSIREHGDAAKTLTDQYLSDLRALLRPDQEVNWPKLERMRRRESTLTSMMTMGGQAVGGASVDLFPLVSRLQVPMELKPKVDEILSLYEVDIDRPLVDRERNFEDDRVNMGGVQQFTPEKFEKKLKRDREVDMRVREVNDKYVRLIGAELPTELAAKLADEYQAKAYRSAYRGTTAGRELTAAEKLDGLSAKQREQLRAMQEKYKRDAKAAGDRLAEAIRRAEDEGKPTGGGPMMFTGHGHSEQIDPQVAEAKSQRRALDTALRGELERLLSPEQLASAQEAAKPQGGAGRRIEVFGDGMSEDLVFVSDIELDEDFEGGEGGEAIMIIHAVEGHEAPPPSDPK